MFSKHLLLHDKMGAEKNHHSKFFFRIQKFQVRYRVVFVFLDVTNEVFSLFSLLPITYSYKIFVNIKILSVFSTRDLVFLLV